MSVTEKNEKFNESKNISYNKEEKKKSKDRITFIVSGHVDHGKSTLLGFLLYKYGQIYNEEDKLVPFITEHDMENLRKKAQELGMPGWEYAYVLDICSEERESGKTFNYTAIDFEYKNKSYRCIDTPGHKCYIRELLAALNDDQEQSMVGVLLISAIENEFISGITAGQQKKMQSY